MKIGIGMKVQQFALPKRCEMRTNSRQKRKRMNRMWIIEGRWKRNRAPTTRRWCIANCARLHKVKTVQCTSTCTMNCMRCTMHTIYKAFLASSLRVSIFKANSAMGFHWERQKEEARAQRHTTFVCVQSAGKNVVKMMHKNARKLYVQRVKFQVE